MENHFSLHSHITHTSLSQISGLHKLVPYLSHIYYYLESLKSPGMKYLHDVLSFHSSQFSQPEFQPEFLCVWNIFSHCLSTYYVVSLFLFLSVTSNVPFVSCFRTLIIVDVSVKFVLKDWRHWITLIIWERNSASPNKEMQSYLNLK